MKTAIVIPAYQPNDILISLVDELQNKGFPLIVIINDGSSEEKMYIFNELAAREGCLVIHHSKNLGKGIALKSGIDAVLHSDIYFNGIITADADGQHKAHDIIKLAESLEQHEDALIIGCRNFSEKNIPMKSKLGNKLTCIVFRLATGIKITDTQTGLRAFSLENARRFVNIEGNRYEYEMNMLCEAAKGGVPIKEIGIETVYLDKNRSSHFHPIFDSFYVYKNFLKYALSAVLSFLLDIALYAVFSSIFTIVGIGEFIVWATIMARILSSVFNFVCNKRFVFNNKSKGITIVLKYYALCVMQMLISALLVRTLYGISAVDTVLLKCIVDIILACISYKIQKWFIFRR